MVLKQVLSMMVGSTCFFVWWERDASGVKRAGLDLRLCGGGHKEGSGFVPLSRDKMF